MHIFTLADILPIIKHKALVIDAVRSGFVAHAKGDMLMSAMSPAYPYFCIKVASGFYNNPSKGLPVNNGCVMLLSAETGTPLALFQDEGYMTSVRTAAAGALAAELAPLKTANRLGILGTGHQARLQARWIAAHLGLETLSIWGRSSENAQAVATELTKDGFNVRAVTSLSELCEMSDIIVTTTPATTPILSASHIRAGHHIIALGADSPGKTEIDSAILGRADYIFTDDHAQCLHHGEFGAAVRAGYVSDQQDSSFGQALSVVAGPIAPTIEPNAISVVDLTGLGAQDLAISAFIYTALMENMHMA